MKNFKKLSLIVIVTPVLFVGCVSEKTALIKPETATKEIVTLEQNQSILKEDTNLTTTIDTEEIPAKDTQKTIVVTTNENFVEQALSLNNSWQEFTKEDEILETAKEFLGVKYIWAANGPFAFDCSGFTKYVFKTIGISLPRYSGHQANMGEKIKFQNLEKGDLVFFDTNKKFTRHVNHVGIFIGDNKFIHASSAKKKVIITSFDKKKFYKNKFLYARRVFNTNESVAFNINLTKSNSLIKYFSKTSH